MPLPQSTTCAATSSWQRTQEKRPESSSGCRVYSRRNSGYSSIKPPHLQLRNTESRHDGSEVTNLLRGVPQNPLLRPRLSESLGPPTAGSSSNNLKSTGWGGGVFRSLSVLCNSLTSSPALAFFCPRDEWCNDVAREAPIDCCSCCHHERSRRCFLRCAAPVTGCSPGSMER